MRMRMSRMKPSVIFCLALSALLVGLSRCAVRPVDGPGMERSPADYGHEADTVGGVDRVKAPGVQGGKGEPGGGTHADVHAEADNPSV